MAEEPRYLLLIEACRRPAGAAAWRFLLHQVDTGEIIAASDVEEQCSTSRAAVLALVRGLEALDAPGSVTLLTHSQYIKRALGRGLNQWKQNAWRWELFGSLVPVRNADLWQRVDQALGFHAVTCHAWQTVADTATAAWTPAVVPAAAAMSPATNDPAVVIVRKPRRRYADLQAAACRTVQRVGDQLAGLMDASLAPAG